MVSESVLPDCGQGAPEDLLETWAMIEQAKGILMAGYRSGLDGAFGLLGRAFRASNGGSPAHPNWYYNLKAHPRITVEVGTQTFTVLAQELDGTARAELWPKLIAEWPEPAPGSPDLGATQAGTTRQFPVFLLTRQE